MGVEITLNTNNLPTFPSYNYAAFIKQPSDLSMGTDVNGYGIDTISANMGGLIDYIDGILISGTGPASSAVGLMDHDLTGQPLGNAYFYHSGMTCKHPTSGLDVSAMMYTNNVSTGNIPFISSMGAGDVKSLRGLIPGIFQDLEGFDPRELLAALTLNKDETCFEASLPVTNIGPGGNNYAPIDGQKTGYATEAMFKQYVLLIDPCLFIDGKNPADSNITCPHFVPPPNAGSAPESFSNINPNSNPQNIYIPNLSPTMIETSDDIFIQIYFIAVAILFLFILLKLLLRKK